MSCQVIGLLGLLALHSGCPRPPWGQKAACWAKTVPLRVLGGPEEAQYQSKVCGNHDSNTDGAASGSRDQIWSPGPSMRYIEPHRPGCVQNSVCSVLFVHLRYIELHRATSANYSKLFVQLCPPINCYYISSTEEQLGPFHFHQLCNTLRLPQL